MIFDENIADDFYTNNHSNLSDFFSLKTRLLSANIAIPVVEFSREGYKIRKVLG